MQTITNAELFSISLVPAESLPYPWNEICLVKITEPKEAE